jgi:hypothetical protein
MSVPVLDPNALPAETRAFYRQAVLTLKESSIPFLIGGAYSFAQYTGIQRHTKDFDVFVLPEDSERALLLFAGQGFRTELTFPHWLGKVYAGENFIDLIFSSGNGLATVDDAWFAHAGEADVFGEPVLLCPPEETVWSKAFIQERERFDGADVTHLIRARGRDFDWARLLRRFGPHWPVLLGHLILFRYIYPGERDAVPDAVLHELLRRQQQALGSTPPKARLCRGTLLSREQYLPDIEQWGYQDARLEPRGTMSAEEVAIWTDGIESKA